MTGRRRNQGEVVRGKQGVKGKKVSGRRGVVRVRENEISIC